MARPKNEIAFAFILDYLHPLPVRVRPMFGCHAVYLGEKILLVVRKKPDHAEANGIWIATSHEHHASLAGLFPDLGSVTVLNGGRGETAWRMLRDDAPRFEQDAIRICELIRDGDSRIGRIPKQRNKRNDRTGRRNSARQGR